MDIKERKPYRSLTKSRREKERRYTSSSVESDDIKMPHKSYSSSETLKAYDQDPRLAYSSRVKDLVHQESDEYSRPGTNFSLRELGLTEATPHLTAGYHAELGLPHRGYSLSTGSDADTETDGVMSPDNAMRLWGRNVKSSRSSCLSSRANSALTLTDTEHENTENGPPLPCSTASSTPVEQYNSPPPPSEVHENQRMLLSSKMTHANPDSDSDEEFVPNSFLVKTDSGSLYVPTNGELNVFALFIMNLPSFCLNAVL